MTGLTLSVRLKKRCELFGNLLMLINDFSSEINYLAKPVDEIVIELRKSGKYERVSFISICVDLINSGHDFPEAWCFAIDRCNLPFKAEEKEKLKSLGLIIGRSDINGQNNALKMYYDFFVSFCKRAEEEKEKYFTMTFVTCFLCGCALFILMI